MTVTFKKDGIFYLETHPHCEEIDREGEVKDESIEDTILDLANYSLILLAKIKSRKDEKMLYN